VASSPAQSALPVQVFNDYLAFYCYMEPRACTNSETNRDKSESSQSPRRPGTVMDSFAQTSSGCAEARAANTRRCRGATDRSRPQPRARRKVVARSVEEGPVVAAADVPRRRTAMPSPAARGRKDAARSHDSRRGVGCGPGAATEHMSREAYLPEASWRTVAALVPDPRRPQTVRTG
jgi:hypothetical protein